MKEITILNEPPVILTKDVNFMNKIKKRGINKSGDIILLPEDAILVQMPIYKIIDSKSLKKISKTTCS